MSAAPLRFTAWSWSRLQDYEGCPRRARLKHILKLPDPGNAAMARGNEVHEELAAYLSGEGPGTVPPLARWIAPKLRRMRALGSGHAKVELKWGLDAAWRACSWFGEATRLRVVVDLLVREPAPRRGPAPPLLVVDWKTGKVRPKNNEQLDLYAAAAFHAAEPRPERVAVNLVYLDAETVERREYEAADADRLREAWDRRALPMLQDRKFAPRPGDHCRWCPYSAAKGGPCEW